MRVLSGLLCSLPMLFLSCSPHPHSLSHTMHILDSLMLFPLLMSLHNMCTIASISLVGSLISCPQSVITLIRLMREKEFLHGFTLVVASHVDKGRHDPHFHIFYRVLRGLNPNRGALSHSTTVRSDGTTSCMYPPDDGL